jgi:hypothetical protein
VTVSQLAAQTRSVAGEEVLSTRAGVDALAEADERVGVEPEPEAGAEEKSSCVVMRGVSPVTPPGRSTGCR